MKFKFQSMADFDLSAFLAEQQSVGVSQGEGGFTVSHEKAAQKMAKYSLPREFAWVLKIVQAAMAAKCTSITVTQSRTSSTFLFEMEDRALLPTMQELVRAILQLTLESEKFVDRLGAALRMLVEKSHQSFLLRIDRGEGDPQSMYAGVYYGEMSEGERSKEKAQWQHPLCLRINHVAHTEENRFLLNLLPVKDQTVPLLLELERYAYVSPIPITLDGRRLDGILRTGALTWSARKKPIRAAGLEIPGDDDPPFSICPGFANRVFTLNEPSQGAASEDEEQRLSEAYFVLSLTTGRSRQHALERTRRCFVCWVRDGVVVEEELLGCATHSLGLRVYVCANDIGSDLTGFQLSKNQTYRGRRERLLNRLRRVLEIENQARRELFAPPEKLTGEPEQPPPRFSAFLKTLKFVKDTLSDQNAYWDRMAIETAYRMDLRTLTDWLAKEQESEDTIEQAAHAAAEAPGAKVMPASHPVAATKETFKWRPPEER